MCKPLKCSCIINGFKCTSTCYLQNCRNFDEDEDDDELYEQENDCDCGSDEDE